MAQSHSTSAPPEREIIDRAIKACVQIVALKKGLMGGMSTAWNGSGTMVHPAGIILTNCHVANPRAMGMPAPAADRLAIAITDRSDEPPVISYFAEIMAQVPQLDLAVLRIVAGVDGRPVKKLNLPFLPVGNSDQMDLGESLSIFGFPGIGGDTLTYTQGTVAGFTRQEGVKGRAWIKTDATIAGGNSGGTAVNHFGYLVGIPTQAAAGTGVTPVDARPVVDTNRDGRVDHRDTPMAIGGFINGLRPVNLAAPLLQKIGVSIEHDIDQHIHEFETAAPPPPPKSTKKRATSRSAAPAAPAELVDDSPFDALMFASRVTRDGRPVAPSNLFSSGGKEIFATFEYEGMKNGAAWSQVWSVDGKKILDKDGRWEDGAAGRKVIRLANPKGLPDGTYHLVLTVGRGVEAEGKVSVGKVAEDMNTQVSGQIVDAQTGKGVRGATLVVLKPGVGVRDFAKTRDRAQVYTSDQCDAKGRFQLPQQLMKGQSYGLMVLADGYQDIGVDRGLSLNEDSPERVQVGPIPLQRG
jgi:hypothetical protein